jgi:hypothetical protein
MIISSSGDIYITGSSENDTLAGRINKNWVTLGYDPSGVRIFLSNYDGPAATDDSPNSLIIYNNQLWVAGNTEGLNNNQKDLTVNNYNLLGVGVKELSNTVQSNAWPNPFSSTCTISIDAKEIKAGLALDLYDLLGNKIMSNVKFNNNQLTIQKGNLAPGIYEFRILSDSDQISHGKLIIN